VKPEQFQLWEEGEAQPTFRQTQVLAQSLPTPFGFFFLTEAPAEASLLPDLRTVGGVPAGKPSVDLAETVRHAVQRQAWFVEYLQEQGAQPLQFVGRFSNAANPVRVAQDIRAVLGVDVEHGQRKWDVYYRAYLTDILDANDAALLASGSATSRAPAG
jgi:phosphoenolpyruvate carboxylase